MALIGKVVSACLATLLVWSATALSAQGKVKEQLVPGERSNADINAITECGARGDGVSDDGPALQRCISTHPSRTILLPKSMRSGECDYRLSQTLSFDAYSTALVGVGASANNNTTLCWTKDVTGISITGGQGQALRNVNLRGAAAFNPVKAETYTTGLADGIRINGGEVSLRDIYVGSFSRNGVNVDSSTGGQADIWLFENVRSELNRGDGFHVSGQDANAGLCLMCIARLNQGWGFYNDAVIPSTYIAPMTDGNHNDPTSPPQKVSITQITVANNVATVETGEPHLTIAGDWGVIYGCPKFFNKWKVISVPSANSFQIDTALSDGVYCNTKSATYGFQLGARVWASGRTVSDATMRAGEYNLTSALAHWTRRDYGTLVCVKGAGAGKRELCSTIQLVTGNIAVLSDVAGASVLGADARIVTNGGPYNAKNSAFVQSYAEGDQEGLSQLSNSLTLGEDWGVGANQGIENTIVNDGYSSPLKFSRRNIFGGYSRSMFQAGRSYGKGNIARDPSYEGFWNTEVTDDRGTVLSSLSFRHSNVTGAAASGWNCFSADAGTGGAVLAASSLCLPDARTRIAVAAQGAPTRLPMLPAGGFLVKGGALSDDAAATAGARQVRYDAAEPPSTCNAGDIFYKTAPLAGGYIGWVCPAVNTAVPFGPVASKPQSIVGEKVGVPRNANDPCVAGQWAADAAYFYVCAAQDKWRRSALSSW